MWGYTLAMNSVDPKQFGLSSRTYLIENKNTISIIIDRKSRIIMKDGKKILDQANAIQKIKKKAIT